MRFGGGIARKRCAGYGEGSAKFIGSGGGGKVPIVGKGSYVISDSVARGSELVDCPPGKIQIESGTGCRIAL